VNNVAPTVALTGAASVSEGSVHTYSFTVSDPGTDGFTVDAGYPTCGLNGSVVGVPVVTVSGGSFDCSFPDGPASTDVKVKVTDSDGASGVDSEDVVIVGITNVDPVITAAAAQSADEGESHSFGLGSFVDPGADSPWDVSVDWGDGSPTTDFTVAAAGSLGSKLHTYGDGPNSYTVSVSVDDGLGSDSKSFQVTVNNVAPAVAISGAANVDEGSAYSLTLGAVTDPGDDTVTSYVVHWGDGGTDTYAANGVKTHTYADGPATRAITVDLVDEDGTFLDAANTFSVTVDNVAPTVTLSAANDLSVNEGATRTYNYTISDPGVDTVTSVDVGCGVYGVLGASDNTDTGGNFECTFPDGSAISVVSAAATDSDGDTGNLATQAVTISNVAPTVAIGGAASVNEGSP
jgi:hypothetical protein